MPKTSDTPVPPIITLGQWSECVELAIHERGRRNPVRFMRWWLPDGGDIFNDRAPKIPLADVIQAELAKPTGEVWPVLPDTLHPICGRPPVVRA